jgi:tetratricopeptide (TPR) repeat protein
VKKPQWIIAGVALLAVIIIYFFGSTTPSKKQVVAETHTEDDGHHHEATSTVYTTDSILNLARKQLNTEQVNRLALLENSITRGNVKDQQMEVFHQLSHFWGDSVQIFAPYAWYEAEAARLENSEKSLTFAARLFLDNLQDEENPAVRQWEALQAKDLFERSLKINPANDSAKVGIGACYLFGGISEQPMTGITMIREVADRDSTNVYAQLTLAKGAMISGQIDRAAERLEKVNRIDTTNVEAILMLAEIYERKQDKKTAAEWYSKSLGQIRREDVKTEIRKRIAELGK